MKRLTFFFSLTLSALTSIASAANNNLPDIGSSASQDFSLVEEQAVGDSYMRQLRSVAP